MKLSLISAAVIGIAPLQSPKDAATVETWMNVAGVKFMMPDVRAAVVQPPQTVTIKQTFAWNVNLYPTNPAKAPNGFTVYAGTNEGSWQWSTNVNRQWSANYTPTATISFTTSDNWEYLYFTVRAWNLVGQSPDSNIARDPNWEPNALLVESRKGVVEVFTSTDLRAWTPAGVTPQTNLIPVTGKSYWRGEGATTAPLRLWNAEKNHFGR